MSPPSSFPPTLLVSRNRRTGCEGRGSDDMQEFDNLKDGEIIYKLVGPVLLKQEKFEADGTVKGRLEYIGSELYVLSPSKILLCLLAFFPAFVSHLSVARDTRPPPPNRAVLTTAENARRSTSRSCRSRWRASGPRSCRSRRRRRRRTRGPSRGRRWRRRFESNFTLHPPFFFYAPSNAFRTFRQRRYTGLSYCAELGFSPGALAPGYFTLQRSEK